MKLKKTGRKKKDGPIQSSVLAHELKTPLSSIKEAINLILKGVDGPVTPQQEQTLNVAKRNVDRLVRLVNNVLELGNLEGDTMSLHY